MKVSRYRNMGKRCGYDLTLFSPHISIILKLLKKFFIYFEVDAHTALILLLEGKLLFPVIIPLGYPSFTQAFIDFC